MYSNIPETIAISEIAIFTIIFTKNKNMENKIRPQYKMRSLDKNKPENPFQTMTSQKIAIVFPTDSS